MEKRKPCSPILLTEFHSSSGKRLPFVTKTTLHIGLDDTDSIRGGCTTYIAAVLVEKLLRLGVEFVDYPNLIRLNPNVPWKTRGNGALSLRITFDEEVLDRVKETVVDTVEELSDLQQKRTDPGIVFFQKKTIPKMIGSFAKNTITDVSKLRDAMKLLKIFGGEALAFKTGRGIIGALAAVGETLQEDHTFELIAYRTPENYGTRRRVDETSIFEMDRATKPLTFNNVDTEKKRVIITPRGPDPILFGIRGETPDIVKKAFSMVKPLEPIDRWIIFRTNQGTDAHLKSVKRLDEIRAYNPVIVNGTVSKNPKMIRGRHVIFSISDETLEVDCAAYEPTGKLRLLANKLATGDRVQVSGGVRAKSKNRPQTINLERIQLLRIAPRVIFRNPICPSCGKRLKSMGTKQGYRCEKCKTRFPSLAKVEVMVKRDIAVGTYMAATRSQRHLTKPAIRYGLEKRPEQTTSLIEQWHST